VEQKIAFLECRLQRIATSHDRHLRKPPPQHLIHAIAQAARPQPHLGPGQMPLEPREHPRRVRDIADVHRLPGRAQENARPPLFRRTDPGRRKAGGERGGEEVAASLSLHGRFYGATRVHR
jgi:hypothetical protein